MANVNSFIGEWHYGKYWGFTFNFLTIASTTFVYFTDLQTFNFNTSSHIHYWKAPKFQSASKSASNCNWSWKALEFSLSTVSIPTRHYTLELFSWLFPDKFFDILEFRILGFVNSRKLSRVTFEKALKVIEFCKFCMNLVWDWGGFTD